MTWREWDWEPGLCPLDVELWHSPCRRCAFGTHSHLRELHDVGPEWQIAQAECQLSALEPVSPMAVVELSAALTSSI